MNLRLFAQPTEIKITKEERERAMNFAKQVVPTVNYSDSNQFNKERIRNDHYISKLGEEAVKKMYEQLGLQVKGPDYQIYTGKRKSWQEDLFVDDIGLAVKTQKRSSANRYGLSWTFQCSEKRKDPVLNDPLAWIAFVVYEDVGSRNCLVYPVYQIRELHFKAPKLKHLHGKKRVVYAKDFLF